MSARDEILARVRNAVADVTTGTGTYAAEPVPGAASPGTRRLPGPAVAGSSVCCEPKPVRAR